MNQEIVNERILLLNRYCDGLRRAEDLALQEAKAAFAKGKDEVAKALRYLAGEINESIVNAEIEHVKRVDYAHEAVRKPIQVIQKTRIRSKGPKQPGARRGKVGEKRRRPS